jgi:hypothetical protein
MMDSDDKMIALILLFAALVAITGLVTATVSGCGPVHHVIDPNAGDPDDCKAACDNMQSMDCPGWKGNAGPDEVFFTDDDISCEEICIRVTNAGIGLEQACVAAAVSCEAMERCQNN